MNPQAIAVGPWFAPGGFSAGEEPCTTGASSPVEDLFAGSRGYLASTNTANSARRSKNRGVEIIRMKNSIAFPPSLAE
jgi:hypothetical protein